MWKMLFAEIESRNVSGIITALEMVFGMTKLPPGAPKPSDFNILKYVTALDPDTNKQYFYELPDKEVSLEDSDMYFRFKRKTYFMYIVGAAILVFLVILVMMLLK